MDYDELRKFDLHFPSHWIDGPDRDWACKTLHVLELAEDEFVRAVSSYSMFEPVTQNNIDQHFVKSKYERCLNGIYATSFVFSLDMISKLLGVLKEDFAPPEAALSFISKYETNLGYLKHIRDSVAHIEDRGRGLDKKKNNIPTRILVLGGFSGNRFDFTGGDGTIYGIELSEPTLLYVQQILQGIIDSYTWWGPEKLSF